MEIANRSKGRPKKDVDRITHEQFGRAARVLHIYNAARERGEKYSAAVRETVEQFRQLYPRHPISETEVKRILAAWQPKGAQSIVRFEPKTLTENDFERIHWIRDQLALAQGKQNVNPQAPSGERKPAVYTIRFAERPDYPRHNGKNG